METPSSKETSQKSATVSSLQSSAYPPVQLPSTITDFLTLQQLLQTQIILSACFPNIGPFAPPPVKKTVPPAQTDNPVILNRALRAKEEQLWKKLLQEQEERHRRTSSQPLVVPRSLPKSTISSRKGIQKKLYVPPFVPGPYIIETPLQAHERRKKKELQNAVEFLNKYNELIPRQQVRLAAECGKLLRKRLGLAEIESSPPVVYPSEGRNTSS